MKEVEVIEVDSDVVRLKVRERILECRLDCFGRVETLPQIREEKKRGNGIPLPQRVVNEINKIVHEKLEGGWTKTTRRTPSKKKVSFSENAILPFRTRIKPRH